MYDRNFEHMCERYIDFLMLVKEYAECPTEERWQRVARTVNDEFIDTDIIVSLKLPILDLEEAIA